MLPPSALFTVDSFPLQQQFELFEIVVEAIIFLQWALNLQHWNEHSISDKDRVTRLGDFSPFGLLLETHCDFLIIKSSPKKLWHFRLQNFHQNKLFETCFCSYFKVYLSHDVDILIFFGLATVLATFQIIWVIFFNLLVTVDIFTNF